MPGETILNQRYELVAQQGSGGMAVMYRALDKMLGRMVAVKILRPTLTKYPAFLEKFQQEARSVAMMSHPNIVIVHDVGSDGTTHYIIMELIVGDNLKTHIKRHGAMPFDKALDYGIQICDGLGFAHRAKMVHADVKPQNLVINQENVLKVTDFGIAQAYTDTMTRERSDVVWGSPHYFAPEQARGEKPLPASDVYSIGVVLFEMFTGRLPYIASTQRELALAHIQAEVPRAIDYNADLPADLSNIIYKAMQKRPNDRYRFGDQLGGILRRIREHRRQPPAPAAIEPAAAPAPSIPQPPAPAAPSPEIARALPRVNPLARSRGAAPMPAAAVASQAPQPLFYPDGSINPDATGGYTGHFLPQRKPRREGADMVTIALVVLAFLAVAGLVPLYLLGVLPLIGA